MSWGWAASHSPPAAVSGERYKLPQRGPEESRGLQMVVVVLHLGHLIGLSWQMKSCDLSVLSQKKNNAWSSALRPTKYYIGLMQPSSALQ